MLEASVTVSSNGVQHTELQRYKQGTVSQLRKYIFTFHIAIQHVLKKNNFVVLTFWFIDDNCVVHFGL